MLLLSGCAPAAPQTTQPPKAEIQYDPTPQKTREITLGGKALSGVYSDGEREYLKAEEVDPSVDSKDALHTKEGDFLPLEQCIPEGYHLFEDSENNRTYYTAYPLAEEIPEGYEVPTLMYHAVADECWSSITQLFVKPAELEKQIQWLLENGYTPIHFEDLGKVDSIEKPILLTFDDGYLDNYTNLFPILKKYNVKATIFMIMGSVGGWNYLTADQIKEMDASGLVSFQSHTMTHEFLSTRTEEQLQTELYQSKLKLARLTGKESFVLCYPTGKYSQKSLEATAEHYQFGLLMSGRTYKTGTNPLKITRKYIARSTTLQEFADMIE
jgi:peptidoglycan/xylan/chitin deacetylase (PgdA/CDA1 family)